jgi:hypothetical protein
MAFHLEAARRRVETWTGRPLRLSPTNDRIVHKPGVPVRRTSRSAKRRTGRLHDRVRPSRLPATSPTQRRTLAHRLSARGRSDRNRHAPTGTRGSTKIEKDSAVLRSRRDHVPMNTRVDLPEEVREPYDVFVNGVPQQRGTDYEQRGRSLLFTRELRQERRLGFWRWTSIFLGIAGTYLVDDVDPCRSPWRNRLWCHQAPSRRRALRRTHD